MRALCCVSRQKGMQCCVASSKVPRVCLMKLFTSRATKLFLTIRASTSPTLQTNKCPCSLPVHWATPSALGYTLCTGLHPVHWATPCALGYTLCTGLHPVHWATPCALGYTLCTGLHPVHWATPCALGYTLCTGLHPVHWATPTQRCMYCIGLLSHKLSITGTFTMFSQCFSSCSEDSSGGCFRLHDPEHHRNCCCPRPLLPPLALGRLCLWGRCCHCLR